MVFSLFKKQPEKMVSRPAVSVGHATGRKPSASEARSAAEENSQDFSTSEIELGFTESSLDFRVSANVDPVNASAEEAAILFASRQDKAAQTLLENAVEQQRSGSAERLWLMLFDLYRLSGERSAFDAMGIEYAHAFEKSPPGWGFEADPPNADGAPQKGRSSGLLFKGELLGGNTEAFEAVREALEKNRALRLDVSKVKQIDAEGCESLHKLLLYAKKEKHGIDLVGQEALCALVKERVEAGKGEGAASGKGGWLLLFELLQRQGRQDVFEDTAIDYAVTFEESPPSWETAQAAPLATAREAEEAEEAEAVTGDGAYALSGEVSAAHFDEMLAFAQEQDVLLIDCAKLTRLDFASAGALLNALGGVRGAGKPIVFRHPNHLVSELFRLVGLDAVASCVYAKY